MKHISLIKDTQKSYNSPFNYEDILLRTEKLSSAIYLVTDLMSDKEPLKWKLRSDILETLSFINESVSYLYQKDILLNRVQLAIGRILSLLKIASMVGIMSPMNYEILKREHNNLIRIVSFSKPTPFELNGDFFATKEKDRNNRKLSKHLNCLKDNHNRDNIAKRQPQITNNEDIAIKDIDNGQKKDLTTVSGNNLKDTNIKRQGDINGENTNNTDFSRPFVSDKFLRKKLIMDFLKDNVGVTIKDIYLSVGTTNFSEKTIQRDLMDMMSTGAIRRDGKKRWSRYTLNSNGFIANHT